MNLVEIVRELAPRAERANLRRILVTDCPVYYGFYDYMIKDLNVDTLDLRND